MGYLPDTFIKSLQDELFWCYFKPLQGKTFIDNKQAFVIDTHDVTIRETLIPQTDDIEIRLIVYTYLCNEHKGIPQRYSNAWIIASYGHEVLHLEVIGDKILDMALEIKKEIESKIIDSELGKILYE